MKEALKKQEPKQRVAFRNKYLAAVLAVAALLICSVASAQTDSLKYSQINGYGFKYKRMAFDSVLMIPQSSSPHAPYRRGALRYRASDSTLQLWTGYQWNSIVTGVGNGVDTAYLFNDSTIAIETPDQDFFVTIPGRHWTLQGVTDNGPKTTDTIITKGVRTNDILPDTLSEADFEIDVLPDLQYQTLVGYTPPAYANYTFDWIVANKTSANIKAVLQVGDLTDDGNTAQFSKVDSNYDKFDAASIPYLVVPGNHDYDGGSPNNSRLTTVYDTWMGPSRYTGLTYYGGNYLGSNANYYIKLDVGSKKYLVIGLEFQPRDAVLTWAQSVLDSNKNRETIVVTHGHITQYGEKAQDSSLFTNYGLTGNNGVELWNNFIRKNKQIIMSLNGHYVDPCCGGNATVFNNNLGPFMHNRVTQTGDSGNVVHQIGYNHQSDSLGGAGQIMRFKFKPSQSRIDVSFFNAIYQGNDPRSQSYSLNYLPVKVDGALSVKGMLNVASEATFDSSLKVTGIPKFRAFVSGVNGKLDSTNAADSLTILVGQGANNRPKFDTLPGNSNAYIRNLLPVPATTTGMQTGNFWLKGSAVVGGPTGSFGLIGGTPATMYVSHQGGNFGLSIQRATAGTSGANMAFYHTQGTDFTTPVAVGAGDELGTIRWFGTAGDLSARVGISLRSLVETVGTDYISAGFNFRTTLDAANADITRMRIRPNGNVEITDLASSGDVLVGASNAGLLRKVFLNGLSFNATGDTLTATGGLTGTGTTNTVAKFTASTTLGNSSITDDGTNVGVGGTGLYKFHVVGNTSNGPTGLFGNMNVQSFTNTNGFVGNNLLYDAGGGGYKYIQNGEGVQFHFVAGELWLETAGSGSAGAGASPVVQAKLLNNGNLQLTNLASGGTAPTTSGTTKMVITDANGLLSFSDDINLYSSDGTLASDRTVSTGGNTLTLSGTNDNETSFSVVNNGTTNASAIAGTANGTTSVGVSGTSSAYIGMFGNSTSNTGVQGQSSSGVGVIGVSSTGAAFRGQINPASTNAIENAATILRTTSAGAGANGLGAAIQYELETATNGTSQIAGSTAFVWSDATNATRTSRFEIYGVNSTTTARKAALAGNGQWTWDGYGAGTHTGTPTFSIQTTSSGAIIEGPLVLNGTYTPTITNGSNVDATTAYACQWSRVGNVITISGKIDVDATINTTATEVGISLPVASAISNDYEVAGTANCPSIGQSAAILGDAGNNRASLQFICNSVGNNSMYFIFSYQVL